MGSFRATCHLSGMAISENEDTILIPIAYDYVRDTSTLCYGTNYSCYPLSLPFLGKYNGYGSIDRIESVTELNFFRYNVNIGLVNKNPSEVKRKCISRMYALFSSEYDSAQRLEFLNDFEIMDNFKNNKNFYEIDSFDTNEALLSALSSNQLCSVSRNVTRIGHILIKKSFFDAMVSNSYQDLKETISENTRKFIFDKYESDEIDGDILYQNISKESFSSDALLLFNDHNSISYEIMKVVKRLRTVIHTATETLPEESTTTINNYIKSFVNFSLILHIYADIGKSFYPNVSPLKNMKALNEFSNVLSQELEKIKEQNIKDYKYNNGDDEEMPESQKWQAPYIDSH